MLSRTGPTLIQVPFIATMTSLNNDDEGAAGRQDEFGRSPDNEIKTVTPTVAILLPLLMKITTTKNRNTIKYTLCDLRYHNHWQ